MTTTTETNEKTSGPSLTNAAGTFPRTSSLPSQSPIFWVENKDRFLRQLLIRDIEDITHRPLGIYFAQRSMDSSINQADVDRLHEIVSALDVAPFDLIIETRGGETDAAEAMISLLMAAKHPFRAIVPNRAKSNGTLLCLAAESLLMGPTSELGPIEPLIDKGIPASALVDPSDGKRDYPRTGDEFSIAQFHAKHALEQTKKVAERALRFRMFSQKQVETDEVIKALCGRVKFPSHGSVIDAAQAIELGLNVTVVDNLDELWSRVWLLYCMLRHDTDLRNIQKIFETKKVSLSVLNGSA